MDNKLKEYLDKFGIKYIIHEHPAVFTVKEHHKLMKETPEVVHTKNLFLKDDKSRFYLVSMYADKRLDMKALKLKLRVRKLHFANAEELKRHLNLTPGSVSIFGMIYANGKDKRVKLVVDKEVWDAERVGFHPNINTATLEITHDDLEKFYNSLDAEKEVMEV